MAEATTTEPIVREIEIAARPETVFAYFTDPERLTRWLALEATLDPRPGGVCHQTHAGGDGNDAGPYHMRGEFLEVEPPRRVTFTWGFTNADVGLPPGATTVEVTLEPRGEGTLVRLVHRGLPPSQLESHGEGWTEMLLRLRRAAAYS